MLWENRDFEILRDSLSIEDKKSRHNLRYACFRIQKYKLEGNPKLEPEHEEIKKTIEQLDGFGGWNNFAITWDIAEPNPIRIVKRKWSIYQEWQATLERVTVPLETIFKEELGGGKGNI